MIRRMSLPYGWYPGDPQEIARLLDGWAAERGMAVATLAPHAGWRYSGRSAARSIASLRGGADLVVIFGGHRGAEGGFWIDRSEAFETPLGSIKADEDAASIASGLRALDEDLYAGRDNSVEVLLPMVKHFLGDASILVLRPPATMSSYEFGGDLARMLRERGRSAVAIGSSDLTHYGPRYGFVPKGRGSEAARWAREVNDAALIEAALKLDPERVLALALERGAACSPGAIAACIGFSEALGAHDGQLLQYASSLDASDDENFVGYASISYFLA